MGLFTGFLEKAKMRGITYTSLDAMKFFAIINMTADHIGFYFEPHHLWWRAIGRITFPVWFFLVGYSRSRALGKTLWIYAIILMASDPFIGASIFPLNALVSVILSRLFLNLCEDRQWLPEKLPEILVACVLLTLPTTLFFEYGSIAFLFAVMGRMVHTKQTRHFLALIIVSYVTFIAWQLIWFKFDTMQTAYVAVGSALVIGWLARCPNNVIWPQWTGSHWKTLVAVLSRNTLPYYFFHRFGFEIVYGLIVKKGFVFILKFF